MRNKNSRDKSTSSLTNGASQTGNWFGISDETSLTGREKQVLRAILVEPEAKKSFEFLLGKIGCDANALAIQFVQEAYGPAVVDESSSWATEWLDMCSFAKRLDSIARRIEVLNRMPEWKFTSLPSTETVSDRDRIEASFGELPKVLRRYAKNMRSKTDVTQEFERVHTRPRLKVLELSFAAGLDMWIREKTGYSYRDKLAAIQRITYKEAGRSRLPASGETLRKRLYRKSRKLGCPKPPKKPGH
jgi:hypothetical protein